MNRKFLKMIGKRLGQALVTIFLVTMIVFFLMQLIPGDPVTSFLGTSATEEQVAHYRHLYGYDQPVIVQYLNWIKGMFSGKLGFSLARQQDVSEFLFPCLAVTLNITCCSFLVAVVLGIFFGIVAALNRGKWIDSVISFITNVFISLPNFWMSLVLLLVFCIRLHWLPSFGFVSIGDGGFKEWLLHIILPVIVCSFQSTAQFTRQTRSNMLEVMNQEYVTTAKAKGVGKLGIIIKHQFRNALIPLITILANNFAAMLGGTILVESIFVIPGLGNLLLASITGRDFIVVTSGVFVISIFVTGANLLVDILYGLLDPRIREN